MMNVHELSDAVEKIQKRNMSVEADKAWETSGIRKTIIAFGTYILLGTYMAYIGVADPWRNALIPTFGFLLSTVTLSWVKHVWVKRYYKKGKR